MTHTPGCGRTHPHTHTATQLVASSKPCFFSYCHGYHQSFHRRIRTITTWNYVKEKREKTQTDFPFEIFQNNKSISPVLRVTELIIFMYLAACFISSLCLHRAESSKALSGRGAAARKRQTWRIRISAAPPPGGRRDRRAGS